jgi:hypothetical protein
MKFAAEMVALAVLISGPLRAQVGALSGTITGPSGAAVSVATVTVKNSATGQATETQASSAGLYSVPNLAPGDYDVSVSAPGFDAKTARVTLGPAANQRLDFALTASSGAPGAPSLSDLGFGGAAQGSAQEQARLDKRSHMLKTHQRLGLITTIPLAATLIAAGNAGGHHSTSGGRELHAALGAVTAGMYLTTASFAIFAPKVPGTKTRGPIRVHKALAWIHGPGMILTPILGAMAYKQLDRGEQVHGIAKAHSAVAAITSIAYGAAIVSVSFKF